MYLYYVSFRALLPSTGSARRTDRVSKISSIFAVPWYRMTKKKFAMSLVLVGHAFLLQYAS